MSALTGCPGSGEKPAPQTMPTGDGRQTCARCGGIYRLRADGRMRAHRVDPSAIVPAIRGARFTSGTIRSSRA